MTTPLHTLLSDDGDLITIADELPTSRASTAQVTEVLAAIDMTEPRARWPYERLGRARR